MKTIKNPKCVVHFSGGLMSFCAAKLAVEKYGKENCVLLFADTGIEHGDLYRFNKDVASFLGIELVTVRSDKFRNPFDVADHYDFLPDWRAPNCSDKLKAQPLTKWVREHCSKDVVQAIGFDSTETKRANRLKKSRAKVNWWFPLIEQDISKTQAEKMLAESGIAMPALYELGYVHNNCGGFCFQGSKYNFFLLWKHNRTAYHAIAQWEKAFSERNSHKKVTTIMTRRVKGEQKPLSLYEFEQDILNGRFNPLKYSCKFKCACSTMWVQNEFDYNQPTKQQ